MYRSAILAAAVTLALAPALAQKAPGPAQTDRSFVERQSSEQWLGTTLIGLKVMGPKDESIGSVSDLLIGADGQVMAAVVGVGGFLGIGSKNVAIPFASLQLSRNEDGDEQARIQFAKEELEKAPAFKPYEPQTAARTPERPGNPGRPGGIMNPKPGAN